mmetsp:Transcript_73430/g.192554  ORF Transcript_73430/g.192554 Transcript_73430/m.192554 type:complete len:130 (+) Transcript_73430:157-546(+)
MTCSMTQLGIGDDEGDEDARPCPAGARLCGGPIALAGASDVELKRLPTLVDAARFFMRLAALPDAVRPPRRLVLLADCPPPRRLPPLGDGARPPPRLTGRLLALGDWPSITSAAVAPRISQGAACNALP